MAHVSNAAPGASPGDADALAASLGSVALGEQPLGSDGDAAARGAAAAPAADDGAVIGPDEDAESASASGDELRAQDATSVLDNAVAALVAVQDDEDRTVSSVVEAMRREGTLLVRFAEAAGSELVDCEGILMLDFVRYGWLQLPEPYSDMFSFCRNYLPPGAEARRFQIDALEALLRGRDVVEVLPCGSGKSLAVAVYCAAREHTPRDASSGRTMLWSRHTPFTLLGPCAGVVNLPCPPRHDSRIVMLLCKQDVRENCYRLGPARGLGARGRAGSGQAVPGPDAPRPHGPGHGTRRTDAQRLPQWLRLSGSRGAARPRFPFRRPGYVCSFFPHVS